MTLHVTSMRKKLRCKPDKLEIAMIMFDADQVTWDPDDVALIIDESVFSGAQLIMKFNDYVKPGSRVKVKLGILEPLLSEVVWRKEVASDLCRVGVKFLE